MVSETNHTLIVANIKGENSTEGERERKRKKKGNVDSTL